VKRSEQVPADIFEVGRAAIRDEGEGLARADLERSPGTGIAADISRGIGQRRVDPRRLGQRLAGER
jgi:hypothetical protein